MKTDAFNANHNVLAFPVMKGLTPVSQYTPRLSRGARGFTLVELLVSVLVVSVLAVIAFTLTRPVGMKVAELRSGANLRTMAQGLSSYVADHEGRLPESAYYASIPTAPGWAQMWYNGLAYYIEGPDYFPEGPGNLKVPKWLQCPGRKFADADLGYYVNGSIRVGISVGYGWNFMYFGMAKSISPSSEHLNLGYGSRMAQVEEPSRTIIIGTNREEILGETVSASDRRNSMIYRDSPSSNRFSGRGLYLFLDGHLEALTPQEAAWNNAYLFKRAKTTSGF